MQSSTLCDHLTCPLAWKSTSSHSFFRFSDTNFPSDDILDLQREYNITNSIAMVLSETDDSTMSSLSESEFDDHTSFAANTAETSFEDSIDPQLCSPGINQGLYNLRNRAVPLDHDETIRSSARVQPRKAMPQGFVNSPQTQLANYFAATALDNGRSANDGGLPESIMQHPPTIPLLDDPARNSKRRSIRLVGTKIPSIGPISKFSMSQLMVGGGGPTTALESPQTMKGDTQTLGNKATLIRASAQQPPSPPASAETESMGSSARADENTPQGPSTEDLDVLLDLEDLKLADKEIPHEKLVEYFHSRELISPALCAKSSNLNLLLTICQTL